MDTRMSEEDLAFRDEVRAFLAEAWDEALQAKVGNRATM